MNRGSWLVVRYTGVLLDFSERISPLSIIVTPIGAVLTGWLQSPSQSPAGSRPRYPSQQPTGITVLRESPHPLRSDPGASARVHGLCRRTARAAPSAYVASSHGQSQP